jgi:hypothetical protein
MRLEARRALINRHVNLKQANRAIPEFLLSVARTGESEDLRVISRFVVAEGRTGTFFQEV